MSKTIDQRVVEMRFDNAQFERETKQSMSTLEKLKKSLNLTGASKGLEEINKAAKNNSIPVLGSAAEAVGAKFSAMQVMGVTALVNLTNSAVNAGKRIVEALTIAPVKDGFQEYEMVLNAVQTTMNATGKTAAQVEEQLKSLDEYADKTIYSTADMLNNLPKFTNAGVELEVATQAMIGIANATALAGGDANKASIAFYNLGQAIGTGYLTRMDYNSINNAGIATLEWKNQMVEAAIAAGTLVKVGEDSYQAGNKTLTLQQLFIDGLQEQWATTEVMLKVFGDYGDETTDVGKRAYAAAQNIKTFTMMMDSLKATAGTGWKETWQLIFGGLDEATKFWTGLTNFLSGIIEAMADWRNELVKKVMGNPISEYFQDLIEGINKKGSTLTKPIESVVKTIEDLDSVVERVMNGEFGNAPVRFEKLTEAGYNYAKVQNKVNEILGCSYRHNEGLADSEKKVTTAQKATNETRAETIEDLVKMSDEKLKDIGLNKLEIQALRTLEEQSKKTGIPINDLAEDLSQLSGRSLLINSFKNIGDALVTTFNAMKTAWKGIFTGNTAEVLYNLIAGFHKLTTYLTVVDANTDQLTRTFKGVFAIFDILATVTMGPLKFGFKALTALLGQFDMNILDVTATIGDAIVRFRDWIDATFDLDKIFGAFAPHIVTIGKAVNEWVKSHVDVAGWIENIESGLSGLKKFIERWMEGLYNTGDIAEHLGRGLAGVLSNLKKIVVEGLKTIPEGIVELLAEFKLLNWDSIPADIAAGFEKGLVWGFASIIKKIRSFINNFKTAFTENFKIASPSKVMFVIGKFVILGFIAGILAMFAPGSAVITGFFENMKTSILGNVTSMMGLMTNALSKLFGKTKDVIGAGIDFSGPFSTVLGALKTFGAKVVEIFKTLRLDKIAAAALGIGLLILAKKALDIISMFGNPFDALGDLFESIGKAFNGLAKNLKAGAMKKRAEALLIIAAAVAVLVFAILPLTELSWEQLGKAAASLVVLALVIAGLYLVLGFVGNSEKGGDVKSTAKVIIMAGSIWLIAMAVKKLSGVALDSNIEQTLWLLAAIVVAMIAVMLAFGKFIQADKGDSIDKAANLLVKMAAALLTMTTVIKIVSGFTYTDVTKGVIFIIAVGALFFAIIAVSEIAGQHADKAGTMLLKMAFAMLVMTAVVSAAAGFSNEDLKKAHTFVTGVAILFALITAVSKLGGKDADKAGKMLLGVGAAMLLMAWAVKIAGGMSESEIKNGIKVVTVLGILIMGVIAVSKLAGQHAMKAGVMLLAFSVALLIMVGIVWIAGKLDNTEALIRGLAVVYALGILMGALIGITKIAKATDKLKTTLILFIVIIGLLVASVIALSFIPAKDLAPATLSIMGLVGVIIALMAATKLTKNTKQMHTTLVLIAGIIALLAGVILLLANLKDPKSVLASAIAIGVLLLAFAGSIKILNKVSRINKTALDALQDMLVIVGALAFLLAVMTMIPNEKIPILIASSIAIGTLLVAFAAAIKLIDKVTVDNSVISNLKSMLTVVVALGAVLVVMAWAIPQGRIPSLIASSVALGTLLLAFSAAIWVLGKAGDVKVHYKTLITMGVIAVALGLLLSAMAHFTKNNIPSLIASTISLGVLLNAFSAAIWILGKAGDVKVHYKTLITMGVIAGGLGFLLFAMSYIPTSNIPSLIASSVALGVLLNAFSAAIWVLSKAGEIKVNLEVLAAMTGIAAALGILLTIMSLSLTTSNIPSLIASSIALGVLLNAFSASIFILSLAGEVKVNLEILATMTLVAIGLGFLLSHMAQSMTTANIPALLASSIALAVLLNAFSASIFILSLAGNVSTSALVAAYAMIPVTAALGVILGKMAELNVEPSITTALSLGIMLIAMSIAVGILSKIGVAAVNAIPATAAMGVVIGELALIIAAIGALSLIPGFETLLSSGGNMLELVGLAIGKFIGGIVAGFAQNVIALLPLIGLALSGFMVGLQPFIMLASQLDEKIVVGMGCLTAAMLLFVGAELLAGLATLGGCGLISAGLMLCGFITAAKPFFDYIQNIDATKVEAAKMIAEMILILTASDLISGITSLFGGSVDFAGLGTKLTDFGKAVKAFSDEVTGIDTESVEAATAAGEMIAKLQKSLYGSGGLIQDIFGEKDLGDFAGQLAKFGEAVVGFNNVIIQNGGIDETSVESAVRAGEAIAGLQSALYGVGGLKQDIFGEKDLTTFGIQLTAFGLAIVGFNNIVKNSPIDEEAVTSAVNAGKLIAGLQSEIEASGGFVQDIFGEKDLSLFATQIVAFGEAMVAFSKEVSGNIDDEAVTSATNAGLVLAQIQQAIPDDKWFDGSVPIDEFGEKIVGFGKELAKYSDEVSEIDTEKVTTSLTAARQLLSIANQVVDLDVTGLTLFENVKSIGATIKAYYDNIVEVDLSKVSQSVSSVNRLVKMINGMADIDTSGVTSFKTAILNLSKTDMDGFVETFKDTKKFASAGVNIVKSITEGMASNSSTLIATAASLIDKLVTGMMSKKSLIMSTINSMLIELIKRISDKRETFYTVGGQLMTRFATGIKSKSNEAKEAVKDTVTVASESIKNYYDSFYDAGKNLVAGFVNGINDNMYKASAKASAMASAAARAAEKTLEEKSPSKVGYKIGDYFGIGFVNGIANQVSEASYAGSDMANAAKRGLSNAVSKVNEMITDGIDTQPTIRPVLDLSDVESGASTISGLFNNPNSVGVLSNVRAINTLMSNRNQNGVNDDVVSAIDKLRNGLDNVGNNYYTIDGITYSSGTEIADAINVLTRAIKMEARV